MRAFGIPFWDNPAIRSRPISFDWCKWWFTNSFMASWHQTFFPFSCCNGRWTHWLWAYSNDHHHSLESIWNFHDTRDESRRKWSMETSTWNIDLLRMIRRPTVMSTSSQIQVTLYLTQLIRPLYVKVYIQRRLIQCMIQRRLIQCMITWTHLLVAHL